MVTSNSSSLTAALPTVAVGVIVYYWMRRKSEPREHPQPLHILYYDKPPSFPFPMKVIAALPDWIRIPLLLKSSKPSPPKDSIDILGHGKVDPYEKKEVLPGTIWSVTYTSFVNPELKKMMSSFMSNKDAAVANAPAHLKETLQTDLVASQQYEAMSEKERAELGGDSKQDMFIAKFDIDGDENSLLIYNPVRLHPQIIDWISTLGTVKFIVSGSSSHTNHLPDAANVFPNAKIICASAADAKCQCVGMRQADFLYDLVRDQLPNRYIGRGTYEDAKEALQGKARLFHIRGDVSTQALFVLVHKHLFEVDLLYKASEEKLKEMGFETGKSFQHSNHRIFYYSMITEKALPKGYIIPNYRCMMMDPTSLLASKFLLDSPRLDGSSCVEMACNLRCTLKELSVKGVCDKVLSVHSSEMTRECFCQRINETWGWLDQKSLLD